MLPLSDQISARFKYSVDTYKRIRHSIRFVINCYFGAIISFTLTVLPDATSNGVPPNETTTFQTDSVVTADTVSYLAT